MFSFSGKRPADLGVKNGRLSKCSWKPNCVCSYDDGAAYIEPIKPTRDFDRTWQTLVEHIRNDRRARIVTEQENYLYAEYASRVFGFVDDLELLAARDSGVIHVRSASRVGVRDFGVNRKRVESLRAAIK